MFFTYPFLKPAICFTLCLLFVACASPTPTPTQLAQATAVWPPPTSTFTVTPTPTETPIPTSTPSLTPSITPSFTPEPTLTSTPWPTVIPAGVGTPVHQSSQPMTVENAPAVTQLAQWGRGTINDIAYSADGQWLAVAATAGVSIYSANDLNQPPTELFINGQPSLVALSPDGSAVAVWVNTKSLELWQVNPPQQLWQVSDPEFVSDMQFSPDGSALVASSWVFDTATGELLASYEAFRVQFLPDGQNLAVLSYDAGLQIFSWPEEELLSETYPLLFADTSQDTFEAEDTLIGGVQFTATGEPILMGLPYQGTYGITGRIEFQDKNSQLLLSIPPLPAIDTFKVVACEQAIYYGEPLFHPRSWHFEYMEAGQIVGLFYASVGVTHSYKIHTTVNFYHLTSGRLLAEVPDAADFALAPDGQTWAVGLQDGRLQIRQTSDGAVLQEVDDFEAVALGVTISPDSQWVAVQYEDEVKVYGAQDGQVVARYPAGAAAFSADSQTLAVGYQDGRIELHQMSDGALLQTLTSHTDAILALLFAPDGTKLFSSGRDCQLNVWDLASESVAYTLENYMREDINEEMIPAYVNQWVLVDDTWLMGHFSSGMGLWRVPEGNLHTIFSGHEGINKLAYLPDTQSLVTLGRYDLTLWQLLSSGTFKEVWHRPELYDLNEGVLAIAPDGALLVVGGGTETYIDPQNNGQMYLYQMSNGADLIELKIASRRVMSAVFAPTGRFFVSVGLDGVVRVWGVP